VTSEQQQRNVTLIVDRVEDDKSKEYKGVMEWKTYAYCHDLGARKWPMVLWVTGDRPVPGDIQATLQRGNLMNGKSGQYDNEFFWDVISWGSQSAVPQQQESTQPAQPQPQGDGAQVPESASLPLHPSDASWDIRNDIDRREALREMSFHRQRALTEAVAFVSSHAPVDSEEEGLHTMLEYAYGRFLALLRKPVSEPVTEPEPEPEDSRPF
jgi:hypothetical protein